MKGNVPAAIKDKEIISVNISSLEAGTQYRGAFEENIQQLLDSVKERKMSSYSLTKFTKSSDQVLLAEIQAAKAYLILSNQH